MNTNHFELLRAHKELKKTEAKSSEIYFLLGLFSMFNDEFSKDRRIITTMRQLEKELYINHKFVDEYLKKYGWDVNNPPIESENKKICFSYKKKPKSIELWIN